MARDLDIYLAGEWTPGTGDEYREITSPGSGEHIATVPLASRADIDRAVQAARKAQDDFRHWTAIERAELLHRIAEAVADNIEEIARIQTLEQGKPYHEESLADIAEANQYFLNAAEDVKRLTGSVIPTSDRNKRMFTFHRPVGVWAAITPWNFPVTIPLEYIGPGLAAGNAVIAKPPEFTSWGLLKLAEAFDAAGVPKGLVSIIPGGGEIGEALVTHPGIDAIGFTGSSATGRRILSQMGIKRSIMEMSGNGPTIVTEDANLEAAAELAVFGARYNAGQVCCATEKVIVLESVHDEFVERALNQRIADRPGRSVRRGHHDGSAQQRADRPQDGSPRRRRPRTRGKRAHRWQSRAGIPNRPVLRVHDDRRRAGGCPGVSRRDVRARPAGRDRAGRRRSDRRYRPGRPRPSSSRLHVVDRQGVLVHGPNPIRHRRHQRFNRLLGDVPAVRRCGGHRFRVGAAGPSTTSPTSRRW